MMTDFVTGLIIGPIILFSIFSIYLYYSRRRADADLRQRIKKYTYKNDESFLGEYTVLPKEKPFNYNNEKKN